MFFFIKLLNIRIELIGFYLVPLIILNVFSSFLHNSYLPKELKYRAATPNGYRHPLGTSARITHSSEHGCNEVRHGQRQTIRRVDDQKKIGSTISDHCEERL